MRRFKVGDLVRLKSQYTPGIIRKRDCHIREIYSNGELELVEVEGTNRWFPHCFELVKAVNPRTLEILI